MKQDSAPIQTNFTSGELSPLMWGRLDIRKYNNGVERLENFNVIPQGGAQRRMGTTWAANIKTSSQGAILLPFQNNTASYVLELGNLYMRFYTGDGVQILSGGTPYELVTPWAYADLPLLDFAQYGNSIYFAHPNYPPQILNRVTDTNWSVNPCDFRDGPYLATKDDNQFSLTSYTSALNVVSTDPAGFSAVAVNDFIEFPFFGVTHIGLVTAKASNSSLTVSYGTNHVDPDSVESQPYYYVASGGQLQVVAGQQEFDQSIVNCYIRAITAATGAPVWCYITAYIGVTQVAASAYPLFVAQGNTATYINVDVLQVSTVLSLTATTGVLSVASSSFTLNLSSSSPHNLTTNDVGRQFRVAFGPQGLWWGKITSVPTGSSLVASSDEIFPHDTENPSMFPNKAVSSSYAYGAFFLNNYPTHVVIHQQRLTFGNTSADGSTIWFGTSGGFADGDTQVFFTPTNQDGSIDDNHGFSYALGSTFYSPIQWMISGKILLVGTTSGTWAVQNTQQSGPITPTNIVITQEATVGGGSVKPVAVGYSAFFADRVKNSLEEIFYQFSLNAFVTQNTTLLSEHILREGGGVQRIIYAAFPYPTIWCLRADGKLAGLTIDKEQDIYAWRKHSLGGSFTGAVPGYPGGTTWGVILSIAGVSSFTRNEDSLFMVVARTVNGTTVQSVEYFSQQFYPMCERDKEGMVFLDDSTTFNVTSPGITTTTLACPQLAGAKVGVVCNGSVIFNGTDASDPVLDGSGKLPNLTWLAQGTGNPFVITIGLPFTSIIKTLPPEVPGEQGKSTAMDLQRIQRLGTILKSSNGLALGELLSAMVYYNIGPQTLPNGGPPDFFTGRWVLPTGFNLARGQSYHILEYKPYPLVLLALVPEMSDYSQRGQQT